MFDGIRLKDRMLGSRFEQAMNHRACTAPGAEDAKQAMEICFASFPWKNILLSGNEEDKWKLRRTFTPKNLG